DGQNRWPSDLRGSFSAQPERGVVEPAGSEVNGSFRPCLKPRRFRSPTAAKGSPPSRKPTRPNGRRIQVRDEPGRPLFDTSDHFDHANAMNAVNLGLAGLPLSAEPLRRVRNCDYIP